MDIVIRNITANITKSSLYIIRRRLPSIRERIWKISDWKYGRKAMFAKRNIRARNFRVKENVKEQRI